MGSLLSDSGMDVSLTFGTVFQRLFVDMKDMTIYDAVKKNAADPSFFKDMPFDDASTDVFYRMAGQYIKDSYVDTLCNLAISIPSTFSRRHWVEVTIYRRRPNSITRALILRFEAHPDWIPVITEKLVEWQTELLSPHGYKVWVDKGGRIKHQIKK